ncbi:MAG TPA: NAD-dependent epimerase/dehydratase family protein, partial [Gemmatimonadaceae bacterium]|nr:NAD-dependent epimerase/dehydratase family protein [Gemmatimonadaceae bacterium]
GGTGFTGPHQVRYAVSRGHKVTVFNRGRRQADLPASVEHLVGDRNTGDLASIQKGNRSWDVVIDNPTTLPFWVRDAGQILKDKTKHYIFISTISTYAHYRTAGMDEDYELAAYTGTEDPLTIKQSSGGLYGPLKVLSEKEAEKWFPGKVTVIRPGLIVGPGDETDRFSYWPVRIARGGEVAAPGSPDDPTQIIDARDLAEWTIRVAEQRTLGIYNATGPRSPLSMAEMLYGIRAVLPGSHDIKFTWLPVEFLAEQKVRGWSDMPTWLPMRADNQGWGRVSIARALAKGLTFRPLAETVRDTLAWFKTLPAERQATLRAGLKPEREAEVLAAWHAKTKS